MRNLQEKRFPAKKEKNAQIKEFDGWQLQREVTKKRHKKIVPKEKVLMRGVQIDRKKKLLNQTRRKVAEMKEREKTNPTRTTNTKSEQNFKRKNMTKVHNFQENYHLQTEHVPTNTSLTVKNYTFCKRIR